MVILRQKEFNQKYIYIILKQVKNKIDYKTIKTPHDRRYLNIFEGD